MLIVKIALLFNFHGLKCCTYYQYNSLTDRPSFAKLQAMKEQFPSVPIMLLTATAPLREVGKMMAMTSNALLLKASVDHPKTALNVEKSTYGSRLPKSVMDGKVSAGNLIPLTTLVACLQLYMYLNNADSYWEPLVLDLAARIGQEATIVYVDRKKSAIDLTTTFNQHTSLKVAAYTGEETSKADKKSVLANWCADEITVVVATSAFGLGVNKPNVRHVFHIGVPDSLESWIQEAGRAGRDGNNCDGEFSVFWYYKLTILGYL